MKAVVVELKNDFAAVLSDEGCIVKVKNNNYDIGQVIQINRPHSRLPKLIGTFAASAAVFVALSVGAWAYASPYTYVSVDVNPSIEFNINRFDRVLHVKAVNDDGETILNQLSLDNLKNKSIEAALTITVEQISESGYFDGDTEGGIVIATSCENREKADALANQLLQTAMQEAAQNDNNVQIDSFSVEPARVQEAKELGVTPGKLNLVEKLQAAAGDSNSEELEEWLDKPVKDIMKATKAYKKSSGKNTEANSSKNIESATGKENTTLEEAAPEMDTEAERIDKTSENGNNNNYKAKNSNEGTDNKSEAAKKHTKKSSTKTAANGKDISKDSINADTSSDSIEESKSNNKDNTNSKSKSDKPNKGADKDTSKPKTGEDKSDSESASADVNKDDVQEAAEKPDSPTKDNSEVTDGNPESSEDSGNGADKNEDAGVNPADGVNGNEADTDNNLKNDKNANNNNTETDSGESSSTGHRSNNNVSNNE